MMKAHRSICLILSLFACFFITSSLANNFYVGGSQGWVLHPSEKYKHWAGRNRFLINDTLIFRYKKGEDSVLLVKKHDYRECNTNNPIREMTSGSSFFQFDRSGPFYFISGNKDHCEKGQKLVVVVLAERTTKQTPSPVSQPPAKAPVHSPQAPSPVSHAPHTSPAPSPVSQSPHTSPAPGHPPKAPSPVFQSPHTSPAPAHSPKAPSPVSQSPPTSPAPGHSPKAPSPVFQPPHTSPAPAHSPKALSPVSHAPYTSPTPTHTPKSPSPVSQSPHKSPTPALSPYASSPVPKSPQTSPMPSQSPSPTPAQHYHSPASSPSPSPHLHHAPASPPGLSPVNPPANAPWGALPPIKLSPAPTPGDAFGPPADLSHPHSPASPKKSAASWAATPSVMLFVAPLVISYAFLLSP